MRSDALRRIGLGAAAVVCATALISGFGSTAARSHAAAPATGFPESSEQPVLGPAGYKALKLGMSENQAVATGLIGGRQMIGRCAWYDLVPGEGPQNPGNGVVISPGRGVVSIPGTERSHTPEGIVMGSVNNSRGSTFDEVKRAYPNLAHQPGDPDFIFQTPVAANPGVHYGFAMGSDDKVKDMNLTSNDDGGCGLSSAAGRR